MLANHGKRSLFGGALRCAGLAAAVTASAPADFVSIPGWVASPNQTQNYAYDVVGTVVAYEFDFNHVGGFPDPSTTNNALAQNSLSAYSGPTLIGASTDITNANNAGWIFSVAATLQYFEVDVGKAGLVSWDLREGSQFASVQVYQLGVGNLLHETSGSAGSVQLIFSPGERYRIQVFASVQSSGTVFGRMEWGLPTGACCVSGGSCLNGVTQDDCIVANGGIYQGDGSNCDAMNCPSCLGDVVDNATFIPPPDGVVDGADLAYLLGEWGPDRGTGLLADFVNGRTFQPPPDGVVNGADLAVLLGGWGPCN